ncbi:hypothetical protein [Roseicella frigidaeris]|uniref:Uncharacterized protein n=1 Tax=Roseicella frigidaeris TaxID=2230885 RepID=A0A327M889_9PROT|nr:hypothetical protein [Roseicella frigidaeris]RAI58939.1 hypothetical protein DOO78_10340 [Roseicella frigidaeris]
MARSLWSLGALLVLLGLAAHVFGWDSLLEIPEAAIAAIRAAPATYGVVALGVLLMLVARMMGRRRG